MKDKHKGLSAMQLTMMALGTVIGGSFFLGSSAAISAAGPAVIIAYLLSGVMVYFILFALSEMTIANPSAGSFRVFAANAFGPGAGFVTGWVYWTGMVLAMSSEATAISILVREWLPDISIPFLGSLIIIAVTLLNLLGADKLSKIESTLAAVKVVTIISFIVLALMLITGLFPGKSPAGAGSLADENLIPGGIGGIAGSILLVMFSYAGFEIIGLAASEARDPVKTIPRSIRYTVISLVSLYVVSVALIFPLIPTAELGGDRSPIAASLTRHGIGWAGTAINLVLVTAILSTMLAAMFGLGRMIRSLADGRLAPVWLRDRKDIPYRGIIFSGLAMLAALWSGMLFPSAYMFLISSGGFALLFTYGVIMATQLRHRRRLGCPPEGRCQVPGFPYTSWAVLITIIISIMSMPLIPGQSSGLIAGLLMVALYAAVYLAVRRTGRKLRKALRETPYKLFDPIAETAFNSEIAREIHSDRRYTSSPGDECGSEGCEICSWGSAQSSSNVRDDIDDRRRNRNMNFCWCTITVHDLEKSLEFYRDIVGLPIDRRFPAGEGKEIIFLGDGETKIELIGTARRTESNSPTGGITESNAPESNLTSSSVADGSDPENKAVQNKIGVSLGFKVKSLDEMIRFIKEKDLEIESGPIQPSPHIRFFFVRDPNGVSIQFIENI